MYARVVGIIRVGVRHDHAILILQIGLDQRQGDHGHEVDDHAEGQRDHEEFGRLEPDELDRGEDAETRDDRQAEPAIILQSARAADRSGQGEDEHRDGGDPQESSDDGHMDGRAGERRRRRRGEIVIQADPQPGLLIDPTRNADRHALGDKAPAIRAAPCPGAGVGGRHSSSRPRPVLEEGRGIAGRRTGRGPGAFGVPPAHQGQIERVPQVPARVHQRQVIGGVRGRSMSKPENIGSASRGAARVDSELASATVTTNRNPHLGHAGAYPPAPCRGG